MKKLLLALVLLTALPALAGTYTVTLNTGRGARAERQRKRVNKVACLAQGLLADCTQPQARDAFCQKTAKTNAPCADSTSIVIHATVDEWLSQVARDAIDSYAATQDADDKTAFEAARAAASQAQKDAACTALVLPAGCLP